LASDHGSDDSDRLRRDIEEALQHGGVDRLPPRPSQHSPQGESRRLPDFRLSSPGQVVVVGLVLLLLAFLRLLGPLSAPVSTVGLCLLAFGALTWVFRPKRADTYWRGRRVDWRGSETWWERLYRSVYRS
jgi:hypothetical protein